MKSFALFICFLGLALASGLAADTLYKKNGDVLRKVKIVGQTRMQVRYKESGSDKVKYIAKSQLRRITYGKTEESDEEEKRKRARELREKKRKAALAAKRRKAAALKRKREAARRAHGKLQEAVRRNIVLPGWGQWHVGQQTKGAIIGGAFVATAGYAYLSSVELQNATRSYLDPVPFAVFQNNSNGLLLGNLIYSQRAAQVEAAGAQLNQSVLLLSLIWAGAFLDLSYADAPGSRAPVRKKKKSKPRKTRQIIGMVYALPPLTTRDADRGSLGFAVQMKF